MINFRIYNMNEHELLASNLTKEQAIAFANGKENKNKRLMVVKIDTEKGPEPVDRTTCEPYWKNMTCVELKKEIVENQKIKRKIDISKNM